VTHLPESLQVEYQDVWEAPECDLLGGILLLVLAVWTVPRVFSVPLGVWGGGGGAWGTKGVAGGGGGIRILVEGMGSVCV